MCGLYCSLRPNHWGEDLRGCASIGDGPSSEWRTDPDQRAFKLPTTGLLARVHSGLVASAPLRNLSIVGPSYEINDCHRHQLRTALQRCESNGCFQRWRLDHFEARRLTSSYGSVAQISAAPRGKREARHQRTNLAPVVIRSACLTSTSYQRKASVPR
jgi:hypothetical protein